MDFKSSQDVVLPLSVEQTEAFVRSANDRPSAIWDWFYWEAPPQLLIQLLQTSPYPRVRSHACEALGGRREASARYALFTAMSDPVPDVRAAAVKATVAVARPQDGSVLLEALNDDQSLESRYWIIDALGKLKSREAIPRLISLLDSFFLRDVAARALQRLDVVTSVPRHMTHSEIELMFGDHEPVPDDIRRLRTEAKVRDLIAVLRSSENPRVRANICGWFHSHPAKPAREALLERLFDERVEVRRLAADAYSKIGRPSDGPIVMGAFRLEEDRPARQHLVRGLGFNRSEGAVPLLVTLLDDSELREDAIWALSFHDEAEVLAALEQTTLQDQLQIIDVWHRILAVRQAWERT